MSNLTRSAKSSIEWTATELDAYKITVSSLPPSDFFPVPDPPLASDIDPAILTWKCPVHYKTPWPDFISYLNVAVKNGEIGDHNLTYNILQLSGYIESFKTSSSRGGGINLLFPNFDDVLQLSIRAAEMDLNTLCIVHVTDEMCQTVRLLVIHHPMRDTDTTKDSDNTQAVDNAELDVIATAIAAFQYNNNQRGTHKLQPLDAMTIPCIKIQGTCPTFYLVPVTTELSAVIKNGNHPVSETRVLKCETLLASKDDSKLSVTSMNDLEYRKLALQRFLAFKEVAKLHSERYLEGT